MVFQGFRINKKISKVYLCRTISQQREFKVLSLFWNNAAKTKGGTHHKA